METLTRKRKPFWNRFRWWLVAWIAPKQHITVRYGKPEGPRFISSRQWTFKEKVAPVIELRCNKVLSKDGYVGSLSMQQVYDLINGATVAHPGTGQPISREVAERLRDQITSMRDK